MASIAAGRGYVTDRPVLGPVRSIRVDDGGIRRLIREVHARHGYVCDPHTACGFAAESAGVPRVMLATASPAKFPEVVIEATGVSPRHPSLDALAEKPVVRYEVPATAAAVRTFLEAHA